jgi:hypothetical protein
VGNGCIPSSPSALQLRVSFGLLNNLSPFFSILHQSSPSLPRSGCIDLHFLDLGTSLEWSASRPDRFAPGTHWIGGWVGPRAGLNDVEKGKLLILPGFEFRPLGRPASRQSLYRLRYPGSLTTEVLKIIK